MHTIISIIMRASTSRSLWFPTLNEHWTPDVPRENCQGPKPSFHAHPSHFFLINGPFFSFKHRSLCLIAANLTNRPSSTSLQHTSVLINPTPKPTWSPQLTHKQDHTSYASKSNTPLPLSPSIPSRCLESPAKLREFEG